MAADHTDLLESVLNTLEEGIVVLDHDARVLFCNQASGDLSGYLCAEMLARTLPPDFYIVDHPSNISHLDPIFDRPTPAHLHHRQGHALPVMLRRLPLRDWAGNHFGTLLRFHTAEEIDALPHGDSVEEDRLELHLEDTQEHLEQRLDASWQEWKNNEVPFGLLWISVDQAVSLRKTHGRDAVEAMMNVIEKTLLHGLRPAEIMGRWGGHEFLVLCHERTAEMLSNRARHLAEVAHRAEFRWWGDRVNITVNIGAAQASEAVLLSDLLNHAKNNSHGPLGQNPGAQHSASLEGPVCSQSLES